VSDHASRNAGLQPGEIEVFRAGNYPQGTYTADDLQHMASVYNPETLRAPLYYDHQREKDGEVRGPAHGWLDQFRVAGDKLVAQVRDASDTLLADLKGGKRLAWSPELYRNFNGLGMYPRALAILGASVPQVKGLGHALFTDADLDYERVEFNEPGYLPAEDYAVTDEERKAAEQAAAEKAAADKKAQDTAQFAERMQTLEAQNAALADELKAERDKRAANEQRVLRDSIASFSEAAVAKGQITKADTDGGLNEFMEAIANVTFKNGEADTNALVFFKEHLTSRKPVVPMGRIDGTDKVPGSGGIGMRTTTDGQGHAYDPATLKFNEQVEALAKEKGISFAEAFDEVNLTVRLY